MAIAFIQQNANTFNNSAGSAQAIPLNANPSVGNTMIAGCKVSGGTTISSITDPAGNTWTHAIDVHVSAGTGAEIWYCQVTNAYGASPSLTVNTAASTSSFAMSIGEFSGVLTAAPVDKTGTNSSASTVTTLSLSYAATTTNAGDLLVSTAGLGGAAGTHVWTPPTSWGELPLNTTTKVGDTAYFLPGSTGTFSHTWTWTNTQTVAMVCAAFFPAVVSAGGGSMMMMGVGA